MDLENGSVGVTKVHCNSTIFVDLECKISGKHLCLFILYMLSIY